VLMDGARVQLQSNFVVEEDLFNGAVGTVVELCTRTNKGPDPTKEIHI
jgi:hypothetical protein